MSVGIGMRGHFGFGEESTYASPVARVNFVEINSESLVLDEARIETASLFRRGIINSRVRQGAKSVSGNIEFEAQYGGWLNLAQHAFGQIDTTIPDPTNAATARLHTFTIRDLPPTGLTCEVFRDTTDFVTEPLMAHVYRGCKINSMEFTCAIDEILKVNVGIIGQDEVRATRTVPSFSTEKLAVYHEGVLEWGNDTLEVESFSVGINNNLEMRPKLGSRVTREPFPAGKVEVTGSFMLEFVSWAQYDDFKNATERQLRVTFTGDLIAAAQNKKIVLTCPVVILSNVRCLLNAPGRVKLEIDFKGYRSASANELTLAVTNTETGI